MKILRLCLLISLNSYQLSAFAWPQSMYTVEKIFNDQFSSLRSYINTIEQEYPNYIRNNQWIFLSQEEIPREIFRIQVERDIKLNYIRETLLFKSVDHANEKFIFERWGKNLQPTAFWDLVHFNLDYPELCNKFRIEFILNMVAQTVIIEKDQVQSNYRLYDYSLEIHHRQWSEENHKVSKLYYQCDGCSGDPLVAIMDTRQFYLGNMSYYIGKPSVLVTPADFYIRANRSYLSGIQREFSEIAKLGQEQFGWPPIN